MWFDHNEHINPFQFGLNGGIPVIVNMLTTSQQDAERLGGTKALWMLSFDTTNRALIKAIPSAIEILQSLTKHPNKDVVKASQGILWEIERNRDFTSSGTKQQKWKLTLLFPRSNSNSPYSLLCFLYVFGQDIFSTKCTLVPSLHSSLWSKMKRKLENAWGDRASAWLGPPQTFVAVPLAFQKFTLCTNKTASYAGYLVPKVIRFSTHWGPMDADFARIAGLLTLDKLNYS